MQLIQNSAKIAENNNYNTYSLLISTVTQSK